MGSGPTGGSHHVKHVRAGLESPILATTEPDGAPAAASAQAAYPEEQSYSELMLRVGVKLPAATGRIGDYVAEVSALEAAGADSIWLDAMTRPSPEPWILLGAMAAVTHRVRLGTMVDSGVEWLSAVDSLQRLSGGRVVVGIPPGSDLKQRIELIRALRSNTPPPRILIACDSHADAERSALLADGVILPGGEQEVRDLRAGRSRDGEFELWVDVPIPSDRAGWATMTSAYGAAEATGIIVSWDPRIIDLLRNAGEADDRTDLLIATG